jgi:hypothetical protein
MVNERHHGVSLVDVVDRVLDKGIVIDAWMRPLVLGIDVWTTIESHIIVASIETYLRYSDLWTTPRTPHAQRSHL